MADASIVSFKYKDYRVDRRKRFKVMTLATDDFIRRFLIHVLPKRFHSIRHYGLLANGQRADNIAKPRELLSVPAPKTEAEPDETNGDENRDETGVLPRSCPCCGGRMFVIEVFARGETPRYQPTPGVIRIDTS